MLAAVVADRVTSIRRGGETIRQPVCWGIFAVLICPFGFGIGPLMSVNGFERISRRLKGGEYS